jgi:hypothetical protein
MYFDEGGRYASHHSNGPLHVPAIQIVIPLAISSPLTAQRGKSHAFHAWQLSHQRQRRIFERTPCFQGFNMSPRPAPQSHRTRSRCRTRSD